ncbi:MAG: hypothetical protein BIFFINMI_00800 [Phycisphaerae bacterium]|nr:hypothetical protein [Phycisphaerae bacterium]
MAVPVGVRALAVAMHGRRVPLFPILWLAAGVCFWLLRRDATFDRRRFKSLADLRRELTPMLLRFAVLAGLLGVVVWRLEPGVLFSFARARPGLFAMVLVLYPLLSVWPQTLIYRSFLFHRYGGPDLLAAPGGRPGGGGWAFACFAAVTFSYMHLIFWNLWAPGLTLLGGLLFARTYQRTGSALISAIEHSLYGDFVFTIGLGSYFYHL